MSDWVNIRTKKGAAIIGGGWGLFVAAMSLKSQEAASVPLDEKLLYAAGLAASAAGSGLFGRIVVDKLRGLNQEFALLDVPGILNNDNKERLEDLLRSEGVKSKASYLVHGGVRSFGGNYDAPLQYVDGIQMLLKGNDKRIQALGQTLKTEPLWQELVTLTPAEVALDVWRQPRNVRVSEDAHYSILRIPESVTRDETRLIVEKVSDLGLKVISAFYTDIGPLVPESGSTRGYQVTVKGPFEAIENLSEVKAIRQDIKVFVASPYERYKVSGNDIGTRARNYLSKIPVPRVSA